MQYIKKLIFIIPSFYLLLLLFWQSRAFYLDPYLILSIDGNILLKIVLTSGFLLLSSLLVVIFLSFQDSWVYVLGGAGVLSLVPLLLISTPLAFYLTLGLFLAIILIYFLLKRTLTTYLNFQPTVLLSPSVKTLSTLLALVISLGVYLALDQQIKQNGFALPDSLINSYLKSFTPKLPSFEDDQSTTSPKEASFTQITAEQLNLLKQNPEALKQYGLDPGILDSLINKDVKGVADKPNTQEPLYTRLLKSQLESIVKPYTAYVAPTIGLLFFFSLKSVVSILSLILSPLILLIFYLLEKSGFTKYQIETREVKKLII
ncbi:MAG: hypothetical protein Q7S88_02875 [Candidatus Daviesbacteria bacterium]|nr:hypothetical protein [Candidatus Daviesbacteria bacterium]